MRKDSILQNYYYSKLPKNNNPLGKYGPGGATTDGCLAGFTKNALGMCVNASGQTQGQAGASKTIVSNAANPPVVAKKSIATPFKTRDQVVKEATDRAHRENYHLGEFSNQASVGQGKAATAESEANRARLNQQYAQTHPYASADAQGNLSRKQWDRSMEGAADKGTPAAKFDRGMTTLANGLEYAGYAEGLGALGELGYGALKNTLGKSTKSGWLSNLGSKAASVESAGANAAESGVSSANFLKSEHPNLQGNIEAAVKSNNTIVDQGKAILDDLASPEGVSRLKNQFKLTNPKLTEEQLDHLVSTRLSEVNTAITHNKPRYFLEHGTGLPGTPTAGEVEHFLPTNNAHFSHQNLFPDIYDVPANGKLFPNSSRGVSANTINLQKKSGYDVFTNPDYTPGSITLGKGLETNVGVLDHEIAHAIQKGGVMPVDSELQRMMHQSDNVLSKALNKRFFDKMKTTDPQLTKDWSYFTNAGGRQHINEAYPFLAEQRRQMINKGILNSRYDEVTPWKLLKTKLATKNDKLKNFEEGSRLIKMTPFWKYPQLAKIMNTAPAAITGVAGAGLAGQALNQKAYGGPMVDYMAGRMNHGEMFDDGGITGPGDGAISFLPSMQGDPEMMYRDRFNTSLNKRQTKRFNKWADKESERQGRDILMDKGAYDVQGFWKSGDYKKMDQDNHGTDTWKKPNHPTFSNQSRYHGVNGFYGGNWTPAGGYQPSKQTASSYGPSYYARMFAEEPNRPEHLDASRYTSGVNAPSPLYYRQGGVASNDGYYNVGMGVPRFDGGGEPCTDAKGNIIPCEESRLQQLGSDAYTAMQPFYSTVFEAAHKYENPETGMISPFNSTRARLKGIVKHPEVLFMKRHQIKDEAADPYHTGQYTVDQIGSHEHTVWPNEWAEPRKERNTGGGWWQRMKIQHEENKAERQGRRNRSSQGCWYGDCTETQPQDQAMYGGDMSIAQLPQAGDPLLRYYQSRGGVIDRYDEGGYTIQKGDTLSGISRKTGVPLNQLISDNNISNPNKIQINQKLIITGTPQSSQPVQEEVQSNVPEEIGNWSSVQAPITEYPQQGETILRNRKVGTLETPVKDLNLRPIYKNFKKTRQEVFDVGCDDETGIGCSYQATRNAQKITGLPLVSYAPANAGYRDAVAKRTGLQNIFDQTGQQQKSANSRTAGWKYPTANDFKNWRAGDIVTLDAGDDPESNFKYDAPPGFSKADRTETSHNGTIMGFTPEGRPIIQHGYSYGQKNKGRLVTEILGNDNRVSSLGHGKYAVKAVWRPKEIGSNDQINSIRNVFDTAQEQATRKAKSETPVEFTLNDTYEEKLKNELPVAAAFSGADARQNTKSGLVNMFNNKDLDKELQYKLGINASELQSLKPVVFGIAGQETNFNDVDNPGAAGKDIFGNTTNTSNSKGVFQIKYDSLTDDEKRVLDIKSPNDLLDDKKAYKAAILLMYHAKNRMDKEVEQGTHPGLKSADPYFRAAYYYNSPARAVSSAEEWAKGSNSASLFNPTTWLNPLTTRERPGIFSDVRPNYVEQVQLRMDKGSYPYKLMEKAKDLNMDYKNIGDDASSVETMEPVVVRSVSKKSKAIYKPKHKK